MGWTQETALEALRNMDDAYTNVVSMNIAGGYRHGSDRERLAFRVDLEIAQNVRRSLKVAERDGWQAGILANVTESKFDWTRRYRERYGD